MSNPRGLNEMILVICVIELKVVFCVIEVIVVFLDN